MLFNKTLFNKLLIITSTTNLKKVMLLGDYIPNVSLKGCDYKIMENQNVTIHEGDDLTIVFYIFDENGDSVDLTDYSASWGAYKHDWTVYKNVDYGGVEIGDGKVSVTLNSIDTIDYDGIYTHELRLINSENKSRVSATGTLAVLRAESI